MAFFPSILLIALFAQGLLGFALPSAQAIDNVSGFLNDTQHICVDTETYPDWSGRIDGYDCQQALHKLQSRLEFPKGVAWTFWWKGQAPAGRQTLQTPVEEIIRKSPSSETILSNRC